MRRRVSSRRPRPSATAAIGSSSASRMPTDRRSPPSPPGAVPTADRCAPRSIRLLKSSASTTTPAAASSSAPSERRRREDAVGAEEDEEVTSGLWRRLVQGRGDSLGSAASRRRAPRLADATTRTSTAPRTITCSSPSAGGPRARSSSRPGRYPSVGRAAGVFPDPSSVRSASHRAKPPERRTALIILSVASRAASGASLRRPTLRARPRRSRCGRCRHPPRARAALVGTSRTPPTSARPRPARPSCARTARRRTPGAQPSPARSPDP